jgi:apolipoprotein N-acyltransferase
MNRRLVNGAVVTACGCLLGLSCSHFNLWPIAWFAWVPVLWIVLDQRTRHAWAYGFVCGLAGNALGFYWFVPYLQRFAHLPLVAALPIFLLLISYHALSWTLFCYLLRRLHAASAVPVTFLAPVIFVAIEFLMPNIFVWYFAVSQAWATPVIQIAELTGPLGVSFLLILSNAVLYETAHRRKTQAQFPWRAAASAIVLVAATLTFGVIRIHQVQTVRDRAPKLTVGVVQGNIGINQKARLIDAEKQLASHQKVSAQLEAKGADVILWPEGAYPFGFRRDQTRDLAGSRSVRTGFDTPLIFGTLTVGGGARYPYNSAMLLDKSGSVRGRFDKNILILFGEYVPFYERLQFIKTWVPDVDNFARGTEVSLLPVDSKNGTVQVGPMICYEDIFPAFGRRVARLHPNLLVNLTNDAWFGDTSEPWEHLASSVFRAVEMRLDLVRAVNTGVSAFIDSTGRIYANTRSVDPDLTSNVEPESLLQEVSIQHAQTVYARMGEWFGMICFVLSLWSIVRGWRRSYMSKND